MRQSEKTVIAAVEVPARASLATWWALSVAALAVHNTEEWLLDMTGWVAGHPWLPGRSLHGAQDRFVLALLIVTATVLVTAVGAVTRQPAWSAEVLTCVACALVVNGASHIVVSVVSWDLMPGTITGTLLLLPLGLAVVRSLPPVCWTGWTWAATVIAALALVAGSLVLAAVLASLA